MMSMTSPCDIFFIGVNEYDSYDMHVEAFLYLLTR